MSDRYSIEMLQRLSANVRLNRKDVKEGVRTVDAREYVDPALYDRELDALFRRQPLMIGHASQVRNPGDFITDTLLGLPIIVARDANGGLNAFVNACIHRAAKVEGAPCGNKRDFICPYHGWSFALDGRLEHMTDKTSFAGAGLDNARLVPIPVVEKHGLVFVQLQPGETGAPDVDLGDMGAQFDALDVNSHEIYTTCRIDLKFGWKVAIDGSLETYHLNYLHQAPSTIFTGMATIFDAYGPHTRFVTARRSLKKLSDEEVGAASIREQGMLTYHMFPNAFLTAPHDHMLLQYYMPTGIDRCVMYSALLVPAGTSQERAAHWDKTWKMNQGVLAEDYDVMESIQNVYAAGYREPAYLGAYEHAVARFHDVCDGLLA